MIRFIRRHRTSASIVALIAALGGIYGFRKAQYLAADPQGEKDCPPLPQTADDARVDVAGVRAIAPLKDVEWAQMGGTINDASCLSKTDIYGIVRVRTVDDIARTLAFARANGLKVSAAGVKHSMGGHAFRKGGIVLDMREFKSVVVHDAKRTMTVQSGATWHDIQNTLHPRFAVRAMQSTDIFTVGGSISVNAHGMDHQAGAMGRSIRAMRVMLADGRIEDISREKNRELFDLVVGGYGLFGIILDAELDIAENAIYQTGRRMLDYKDFPALFAREFEPDKKIALMYGHLSTAPSSFLREMLVYTYAEVSSEGAQRKALGEVSATKLRRLVINLAKNGWFWKELKWFSEKHIEHRMESCTVSRAQAISSAEACLVNRNDPMHDSVPYLRNALQNDTDILHEYFIPRENLVAFIDGMRTILTENKANVLNASVRVVHGEDNILNYSPAPSFSVVLYLNQTTDDAGNAKMRKVTQELIELTLAHGGRFFLPYQLFYSAEQLKRSYPEASAFFAAKRRYDPNNLFTNTFSERYASAFAGS